MVDFQIQKLGLETLGEYLQSVRLELGLTVEGVALKTGIHAKFLEALEVGNFQVLPESVYVVGFLKKLAAVYSVDPDALIAEYYREISLEQTTGVSKAARDWKTLASRLTPRRWALLTSCILGFVFVCFCVLQIVAIGGVPTLVIDNPKQDERIFGAALVVAGNATPGSEVELNGQVVFVGADGAFTSTVNVLPGAQTIEVVARSRFGSESKKTVTFIVEDTAINVTGPKRAVENEGAGQFLASGVAK